MKVRITYNVSGEDLEDLLKNEDIEKVEILTGNNVIVEEWLQDHSVHGHAVSYAYQQFCKDNPSANLSVIAFSKAVKATGNYEAKNMRIGDAIQRCFVALDGRGL